MRSLIPILFLILVAPSLLYAEEPELRRWGMGWSGGLDLRHRLTADWELNLSAGPNDSRSKIVQRTWDSSDPEELQGFEDTPRDDKTESGWVFLSAGRRLLQDGPVSLTAVPGLKFRWINDQDRDHSIYEPGTSESTRDRRIETTEWTLSLSLRPSVALTERLWLETSIGLAYIWSDRTDRVTETRLNEDEVRIETREIVTDSGSFRDFGWMGTSSIAFMIWF